MIFWVAVDFPLGPGFRNHVHFAPFPPGDNRATCQMGFRGMEPANFSMGAWFLDWIAIWPEDVYLANKP